MAGKLRFPVALATLFFVASLAFGQAKKPNIVIIWGDDIGQSNISAYSHGVMGYKTPNIDRIAKEGMMFTDYYGEQSCTAGRASFITGQHGTRCLPPRWAGLSRSSSRQCSDRVSALTSGLLITSPPAPRA